MRNVRRIFSLVKTTLALSNTHTHIYNDIESPLIRYTNSKFVSVAVSMQHERTTRFKLEIGGDIAFPIA